MCNLPVTRKDAKKDNIQYYFTGKSCTNNHISKRYTKSGKCVECVLQKQKENGNIYLKKHREKYKEEYRIKRKSEYSSMGERYVYMMWSRAKKRSKNKNIPFNIEISDITIPECCPVFGIKFIISGEKGPGDFSPSIDRINPKLGYVKGNIQIISFKANRIKSDANVDDLIKVIEYLKKSNV
jgi:hypothetical protein